MLSWNKRRHTAPDQHRQIRINFHLSSVFTYSVTGVRPSVRLSVHPINQSPTTRRPTPEALLKGHTFPLKQCTPEMCMHLTNCWARITTRARSQSAHGRGKQTFFVYFVALFVVFFYFIFYLYFKTQQYAVIKTIKTDHKTHHIRCQLVHVSALRCHHQGVCI